MLGGLANAVVTAALLTIGAKGVPRFGSGVILWFVVSVLAIPTLSMGPPGVYKVVIGLLGGLIWDLALTIFGRSTIGYLVSGAIMMLAIMGGVVGAAVVLGLPAADRLLPFLGVLIPLNMALGLVGTFIGLRVFDRRVVQLGYVRRMHESSQVNGPSNTEQPEP